MTPRPRKATFAILSSLEHCHATAADAYILFILFESISKLGVAGSSSTAIVEVAGISSLSQQYAPHQDANAAG